jgi:hypothetical protein
MEFARNPRHLSAVPHRNPTGAVTPVSVPTKQNLDLDFTQMFEG